VDTDRQRRFDEDATPVLLSVLSPMEVPRSVNVTVPAGIPPVPVTDAE